ncbi:MAG: hypothetical protein ABI599_07880 [Flavobacteriales bacterium]
MSHKTPPHLTKALQASLCTAALFALHSCGPDAPPTKPPEHIGTDQTTDSASFRSGIQTLREFATSNPNVKLCEFDSVRREFNRHFLVPALSGTAWSSSEVAVRWGDVRTAATPPNAPSGIVGLVFHYGISGSEFRTGFSVVRLTGPRTNAAGEVIYDYDTAKTKFYPIDTGRATTPGKLHVWNETYGQPYMAAVKVLRHTGATQRLDLLRGSDTESYVIPWTGELTDLGSQNDAQPDDMLIISSIAGPDQRVGTYSSGYRHQLCCYLRKSGVAQLNSVVDPQRPFFMKAAELGTPCPPRCKEFVLPEAAAEFQCP